VQGQLRCLTLTGKGRRLTIRFIGRSGCLSVLKKVRWEIRGLAPKNTLTSGNGEAMVHAGKARNLRLSAKLGRGGGGARGERKKKSSSNKKK